MWHAWEEARREIPLRRPRRTWDDNIKTDLTEKGIGGVKWIQLAQYRV